MKAFTPDQPSEQRVLIVDDEAPIRELLETFLKSKGFLVVSAASGTEALKIVKETTVHLMLVDFLLPDYDGLELLQKFQMIKSRRPVIVMTGFGADDQLRQNAIDQGAYDCVSKTSPLPDLLKKIRSALATKPARTSTEPPKPAPVAREKTRCADQSQLLAEVSKFGTELAISLLSARHPNLGNTALRTTTLAPEVGKELGISARDTQALVQAAAWHDLSLIRWDTHLIEKWTRTPVKCTADDNKIIHRHPAESVDLLGFCPDLSLTKELVLRHHEHWDGSGFPEGLRGDQVPWLARILAAMIEYCDRLFPDRQAIAGMRQLARKALDPDAIDVVAKAASVVELPRGKRLVGVNELQPSMVLAEDVFNNEGIMILGKDSSLTSAWINKIQSAHASIRPQLMIVC